MPSTPARPLASSSYLQFTAPRCDSPVFLAQGDLADVDVVACAEAGALGGAGSADGTSVVFKGYRYAVLPGGPGIGPTGKKQSCKKP